MDDNRFDLYGALWAYCNRWHGGQSSREYRILSRLSKAGYQPGLGLQQGRFESEQQMWIYRRLAEVPKEGHVNFKPITEAELEEISKFVVPPTIARAGWKFDLAKCREAHEYLGLTLPVEIRFTAGLYTHGAHYARKHYHRITLSQDKSADSANETLWHELCHAWQAEKFARESGKSQTEFYREAYFLYGAHGELYKQNPYEVHAREFATKMADWRLVN